MDHQAHAASPDTSTPKSRTSIAASDREVFAVAAGCGLAHVGLGEPVHHVGCERARACLSGHAFGIAQRSAGLPACRRSRSATGGAACSHHPRSRSHESPSVTAAIADEVLPAVREPNDAASRSPRRPGPFNQVGSCHRREDADRVRPLRVEAAQGRAQGSLRHCRIE